MDDGPQTIEPWIEPFQRSLHPGTDRAGFRGRRHFRNPELAPLERLRLLDVAGAIAVYTTPRAAPSVSLQIWESRKSQVSLATGGVGLYNL